MPMLRHARRPALGGFRVFTMAWPSFTLDLGCPTGRASRMPDQLHRFSNPHHVQFPVSNRLRQAQPVASKGTSRPWSQAGPAIGGRVLGSGGSGRAAEGEEGQSSLGGQHSPMHTEYSMHSRRRSSEEGGCWRQS